MKKHIVITKLFEFGGSNSHLATLIKYFEPENVILILEDENQLSYLKNIKGAEGIKVKINPNLYPYAHLRYKLTTNIKEVFYLIKSILAIQLLSIKYGLADVTISAVEPERHLYLLWIPLSKVFYILHTAPNKQYTSFTSYTCRVALGNRKKIITVSASNKNLICKNWDIIDGKKRFVNVVYNSIIEGESINTTKYLVEKDHQYVVTLGMITAYKNPLIWLEVAKIVTSKRTNAQFIWLGSGPLEEYFKCETRKTDRISFKGAVNEPHTYLRGANIYYQPSLHETHGIAVVEAMSYHLPCVVSDVGGLSESIQDKHNGILVDPMNVGQHVNAIITLLDNPDLRKEYGSNAYIKYTRSFNFENFKAKMNVIYQ